MSRAVTRVDRTILAWIAETPDPAATLLHIEQRFSDMSGRLGYVLSESGLNPVKGDAEGLETLHVTDLGTLTGMVRDDDCRPAIVWDKGTLSVWKAGEELPVTLQAQIAGRKLGDVITHRWLPTDALVVEVGDTGVWLQLHCQEFSVPVGEAREALARIEVEGKER